MKKNKIVTLMVATGSGSFAGSLVALTPRIGWIIASGLASSLIAHAMPTFVCKFS
ncbi:hypothetical protein [Mammaliicoccus vitulinus]|uniref:hypothetical protein n=1 Tax=Mammaliicoccus vitulinus TaxID=71237 RepID=UPI00145AB93D|nr:hypothetical protein [Mammaliicoccus vitulinus]QJF24227.1 hypothetical protein HF021_01510 [Mammaliicoccus vitulinus]